MKKQIFTLAMCLALTATSALADGTKTIGQKTKPHAKVAATKQDVKPQVSTDKPSMAPKQGEQPKIMTREEAKKFFEERRAAERESMYKTLGLSAEQKTKAEALDAKTKLKIDPLMKNVQTEVRKLRELKAKKASDLSILAQKHAVKAAKKEVDKAFESSKKEFESILTEEQNAKFKLIDDAKKKEMAKFKKDHKRKGSHGNKRPNGHGGPEKMGPPPPPEMGQGPINEHVGPPPANKK